MIKRDRLDILFNELYTNWCTHSAADQAFADSLYKAKTQIRDHIELRDQATRKALLVELSERGSYDQEVEVCSYHERYTQECCACQRCKMRVIINSKWQALLLDSRTE